MQCALFARGLTPVITAAALILAVVFAIKGCVLLSPVALAAAIFIG
jgi:hypothetical protein